MIDIRIRRSVCMHDVLKRCSVDFPSVFDNEYVFIENETNIDVFKCIVQMGSYISQLYSESQNWVCTRKFVCYIGFLSAG